MRPLSPSVLPLILLLAASACDDPRDSLPEGEVDAGTAAPGCAYAPQGPIAACERVVLPEPVCAVEYDGDESGWAHFDAQGRRTARFSQYFGTDTSTWETQADGAQREFEQDIGLDGCLKWTRERVESAEHMFERRRDRDDEVCRIEASWGGEVVRSVVDPGCDCREVQVTRDCTLGPHGPLRCAGTNRDGLSFVETWTYDAGGRLNRTAYTRDDFAYHLTFDTEGRRVELWEEGRTPDGPLLTTRYTWRYAPPGTVTRTVDTHDDGLIDAVYRQTYDEFEREVLYEVERDGQLAVRKETTYTADGGWRSVEERDGSTEVRTRTVQADRTTEVVEMDGAESTLTVQRFDDGGRSLEYFFRNSRFLPPRIFHLLSTRDERGRLTAERLRTVYNGRERRCTTAFTWSGPCPVAPEINFGSGCP